MGSFHIIERLTPKVSSKCYIMFLHWQYQFRSFDASPVEINKKDLKAFLETACGLGKYGVGGAYIIFRIYRISGAARDLPLRRCLRLESDVGNNSSYNVFLFFPDSSWRQGKEGEYAHQKACQSNAGLDCRSLVRGLIVHEAGTRTTQTSQKCLGRAGNTQDF
jgi:hypothetical protein